MHACSKWYRTLFKHVPRPLAGLPPLTAAALAEADPRTRRLHFARSTLAALAALSNVYARSTRSASVVPPPSGLATLQLEEPYRCARPPRCAAALLPARRPLAARGGSCSRRAAAWRCARTL